MLVDIILYNLKATGCLVFAIRGRANQQSGEESFELILTCYQICYQRIITDPKKFSSYRKNRKIKLLQKIVRKIVQQKNQIFKRPKTVKSVFVTKHVI